MVGNLKGEEKKRSNEQAKKKLKIPARTRKKKSKSDFRKVKRVINK